MNLTKEPINKLVLRLAAPAGVAMSFNTLYNVTGVFFASRISTQALAGFSMSFLLYISVVGMGLGFGSALTALVGNALGGGKEKLAKIYAAKGVFFVLLCAFFMGLSGFIFTPHLLKILGANDEFLREAMAYNRVIFLTSPFFLLIKSLNGVLVATGDTKSLRNWLFAGLFINLGFCFFYVDVCGLGIGGIALATASVQLLGSLFLGIKVAKTGMINFLNLRSFVPELAIYRKILAQALPACLNYLSMSLGGLVLMHFISRYGTHAVAGYGLALRIEQIVMLPTTGIASAVLGIVSQNFGAREYARVRGCYAYAVKFLAVYCVFAAAFCLGLGGILVGFFDETPEVVSAARGYFAVNSLAFIGYALINLSGSTLQGVKRPAVVFVLNFTRQIVLQIALYSLVADIFGGELQDIFKAMFFNVWLIGLTFFFYTKFILSRVCAV